MNIDHYHSVLLYCRNWGVCGSDIINHENNLKHKDIVPWLIHWDFPKLQYKNFRHVFNIR